ncbi:MAG TPA: beta-galactosidase [Humibacillus xanthopallidus]|nr:beta-galactosidase [Humibacillus xanthopallidus]
MAVAAAAAAALLATAPSALATGPAASQSSTTTAAAQTPSTTVAAGPHTVDFDKYSLMIDGKRTFVWSGEFHYWRLPSPDLWRDMLQKMKAEGYNATSIYFDWAYHSPKQGIYDFTGVRDVDKLLDIAAEVGIYVIARPGPYINAETSGGGFPGWLTNQAGKARSDASDYLAASDEWLGKIDEILARHQLTNGTGTVILYQIENELATAGASQKNYMRHLDDKVKADGITVPIFHNDKGRNGIWVPTPSTVDGTVEGPTDLYAFDGYPGGTCRSDATPGAPSTAPDWGIWGTGGAKGGSTASPDTPGFVAEFGGGWFDYWGSNGTYDCTAVREGSGYERVFYGTNIANRLTLQNFYMTFGGTSWGWLPAPVVYSSYDYGAAFDEARQIRPKATTMKQLGLFLQSVAPITKVDKGENVTPSNPAIRVYDDVNPDTGTHFYVPMHNPSSSTTNETFTFPVSTADGTYTVPQKGTLRINGQDAKILVADYDMDSQHLVYSTSEIMTHLTQGGKDLALLYGRAGEDGETVLRYPSKPKVTVTAGSVTSTWDAKTGDLRLNYTHDGLARVEINGGDRPQLRLLLADEATAGTFWRQDTAAGPVLERGPELVRTAAVNGSTLTLTGDTKDASDLEVWGPSQVHTVIWNGTPVAAASVSSASLATTTQLPGALPVTLPALTDWRTAPGSPESQPGFDDSDWVAADHTATNSTTKPPTGAPVLTADDYGFHQGDAWYRGRYTGGATAATVNLRYGGGGAGVLQAWLDGTYLGQDVLPSGVASPATTGTASFTIPVELRSGGDHVLSVMVRNDGHNQDGGVNDAHKEGRGLISATFAASTAATVPVSPTWRIQGNIGGEDLVDPARGVVNAGGQYGERHGWTLPGYDASAWPTASVPATAPSPGTTWYRSTFALDLPTQDDASLGITIGDPSVPRSGGAYRALVFVNGWNVGQYVADVGPQHTFVVPNGILDSHGNNTLALAVTSNGGAADGLEKVVLTDLGTVRGGVPVALNAAPDWSAATYGEPGVPAQVTMGALSSDAGNPVRGGDVLHVDGSVTNRSGGTATSVVTDLTVPAGWVVTPSGPVPGAPLAPGETRALHWTVTVPESAGTGSFQLSAWATYVQGGIAGRTGDTLPLTVRSAGDLWVSDLPFVTATNGYGPVERDTNVGGASAGDGGPITIKGVTYPKGIGTNSISSITVTVPPGCTTFRSDLGVDDSAGGTRGSVTFSVLVDGVAKATTGVLRGQTAAQPLSVDVTGAKTLTLNVGDAGDGNGHDNADWAAAQLLHCAG